LIEKTVFLIFIALTVVVRLLAKGKSGPDVGNENDDGAGSAAVRICIRKVSNPGNPVMLSE
jgi:hypothetical protein